MNAKKFIWLSGLLVLAGTLAAGAADRPITNSPAKLPRANGANASATGHSRSNDAIIGHLAGRDRVITIKSGSRGALYTVRDAQGKLLCENRSLEQLRAEAPELHQFIKNAVAGKPGEKGGFLDAGLSATR
jgi:hypothetical protein